MLLVKIRFHIKNAFVNLCCIENWHFIKVLLQAIKLDYIPKTHISQSTNQVYLQVSENRLEPLNKQQNLGHNSRYQ